MKISKPLLRSICFFIILAALFAIATPIFERKTLYGAWNYTAKVGGYFNEPDESIELIGFGSSHMYCSVNPAVMADYGISAYVLATQQQPLCATYYYMRDALKTQKPDVFILETHMVNRTVGEIEDSVIADATEPMPTSLNKLRMIHSLVAEKENKVPYYLTLFRYGSRWSELTRDDLSFKRRTLQDEHRGYVYLTDATAVAPTPLPESTEHVEINARDLEYLECMVTLCEENGIRLILLSAPTTMDQESYNNHCAVKRYAQDRGLEFIDANMLTEELSLDYSTDFYDPNHLNLSGSTKLSSYLAAQLGAYIADEE